MPTLWAWPILLYTQKLIGCYYYGSATVHLYCYMLQFPYNGNITSFTQYATIYDKNLFCSICFIANIGIIMLCRLSRLAIMHLHSIRSSALCTHSPYFSPVQSLMLSIHIVLGLPCPLFPAIFPSGNNLCIQFCLIKCPKYWSFLSLLSL